MQEMDRVLKWFLGQVMQQVTLFPLLPFQFKGCILRDWVLLETYPGWDLKSIFNNTDLDFLSLGLGRALLVQPSTNFFCHWCPLC